jgi:hypothetical protein
LKGANALSLVTLHVRRSFLLPRTLHFQCFHLLLYHSQVALSLVGPRGALGFMVSVCFGLLLSDEVLRSGFD